MEFTKFLKWSFNLFIAESGIRVVFWLRLCARHDYSCVQFSAALQNTSTQTPTVFDVLECLGGCIWGEI